MRTFPYLFLYIVFIVAAIALFYKLTTELTYSKDIHPIIQHNCTPCHYENGPGGFSLTGYEDVIRNASFIRAVVRNRYMPPYGIENEYREFFNIKSLNDKEIATIERWILYGMKEGNIIPPDTVRPVVELFDTATEDFSFRMKNPFTVAPYAHNLYVFYPFYLRNSHPMDVINYKLAVDNVKLMHHAWIYVVSRTYLEQLFPEWRGRKDPEPIVSASSGSVLDSTEMTGFLLYTPGYDNKYHFPGTSKKIPADAVLLVQYHYFNNGNREETDHSSLKLYLDKGKANREIQFAVLDEDLIEEQPFKIPAGKVKSFLMKTPPTEDDYTLLKISPHMHYRGKDVVSFAVTPTGDTIPLIKIVAWNFNWQGIYTFNPAVILPKGSYIVAKATFDNTENNPLNPVIPAVDVIRGYRSEDEMFQIGLEYLLYEKGDEALYPQ